MFVKKQDSIEALRTELARKKARLDDLESDRIWLAAKREAALRRRIAELESLIESITAQKRGKALPL